MSDDHSDFGRLMDRLKAGEPAAYTLLYARYGEAIRYAVRQQLHARLRTQFESLDFVQDVWASFLALPADSCTFADPNALGRFLSRIARNKVIEMFRQRFQTQSRNINRERPFAHKAEEEAGAATGSSPSQLAIAQERWDDLVRFLTDGQRSILERLREGYTHVEVAGMLGVNVRTIERVVRRLKVLSVR